MDRYGYLFPGALEQLADPVWMRPGRLLERTLRGPSGNMR
jgi:hypothetical protein